MTPALEVLVGRLRGGASNVESQRLVQAIELKLRTLIERIDRLRQRYGGGYSFTAALAEEGHLPLYGLPVRSVQLIHQDPSGPPNDGQWPIGKGVIDRNEDVALGEFAPDREIVKDKKVLRSVGIAWPEASNSGYFARRITYVAPVEERSLLNCSACGAIVLSGGDSCPECGATARIYRGWRPYAYIADVDWSRDYDGNLEQKPTTILSHPRPVEDDSSVALSWAEKMGFRVAGFQGRLVRANTGGVDGYNFTRVQRTGKLDGVYLSSELLNAGLNTTAWRDMPIQGEQATGVALYSELITDVLIAANSGSLPETTRLGVAEGYKDIAVRAAWDSLAELIGKEIGILEDIEPGEIAVGKKFVRSQDVAGREIGGWAIFITDTLDNGAGYASSYTTTERFQQLLSSISGRLGGSLTDARHSETCSSSCYFCLRSYLNRTSHGTLDWRLGLDLVDVLLSRRSTFDLLTARWTTYVASHLTNRLRHLTGESWTTVTTANGIVFVDSRRQHGLFPAHPLVNWVHRSVRPTLEAVRQEARVDRLAPLDVFDFERQPVSALQAASGLLRMR